jgi:predicted Zn finger-like uncharacterized protein
MKIQCQSCQAKYTIADEKVLGKVVKIRCKKCSATIVINGNEQPQAEGDGADTHVFDYANQSNEQWTVNVADGDQRTMTTAEIAAEYRSGVVNDETYCWKDGMADWLPLREVEQIFAAIKLGGAETIQSVPPPQAAAAAPLFAAPAATESPFAAPPAHSNGNGSGALFGGGAAAAVEHAPAARRAGGRAQGADLFGNVEKAGGEDDVMTSAAGAAAAAAAGGAPAVDEKLTGQRNENSVLFSLSALTDKPKDAPAGNRTTATADGSGLIDIRALSANMDDGEKKRDTGARVDDIMNLSGGGAFGAALAAPILAPPPLEPVDMGVMSATGAPPKQSKTLVFAILGGCAFIAIAIVAAVALTRTPAADPTKVGATAGSNTAATAEGTSTAVAANDTNTPPPSTTTPPTPAGDNNKTPEPPGTGHSASKTGPVNPGAVAPKAAGGGAVAKGPDHAAPTPEPPKPAAPSGPTDLSGALAAAAGKKADAPSAGGGGSSTAPFDRGAAAAALGAVNVASCKKPDGPTGSGHVTVTFSPDGSVASAVIDGGSFPGTPVGGCIAGKYRGAHVPAFGGAPVRVGKSFTIN